MSEENQLEPEYHCIFDGCIKEARVPLTIQIKSKENEQIEESQQDQEVHICKQHEKELVSRGFYTFALTVSSGNFNQGESYMFPPVPPKT